MRPIKLTLQAFGPFAERQEIDFRNSLDRRLFGFYGETGGGKTSILDGLCFALFGESSGLERRGEDLRSHHVGPEVETVVEFVFELGDKRYFIRRLPEQTIKARRGTGETKRPHAAQLFDATAIGVDQLSSDNCGDLLAERVGMVAEKVGEILGYQAPQFRQVVLLPQGQFRELLVANSDDRSKILRKLFDVSLYERLVEALKEEGQALDAQVREARLSIGTHLKQHGVNEIGALSCVIATSRMEKDAAEIERTRSDVIKNQAAEALHAARGVEEKFAEHVSAAATLASLKLKETAILSLEDRACRADQARSVVPLNDKLKEKATAFRDATQQLETARSKQTTAQAEFNAASAALQLSLSRETERERLALEVTRLAEIEQRVIGGLPIRDEALRLKKVADEARGTFDAAIKIASAAEATYEAARRSEAEAQERQTRIAKLNALVNDALRNAEDAKSYARAESDLAQKRTEFSQASESLTTERNALAAAERKLSDAEAALSKMQALHLAGKLVTGEPCPVCGSTDHPAPVSGNADSQGLNKAFEDARTAKQRADQKERQGQSRHAQVMALFDAAQMDFSTRMKPETTVQEAEAELVIVQSELTRLQALPSVETARTGAVDASQKWTGARQALESARTAKDDTASAAIVSAQRADSAFDGIHLNLRSKEAVASARRTAEDNLKSARQRHEAAVTAERDARQTLDFARASLQEHVRTHEIVAKAEEGAKLELNSAIELLGWSYDDYARATADISQHGTLIHQIHNFRAETKSCQDRLDRAAAAVEGLVRPNLTILTLSAQEAATAARAAQERHSQIAANLVLQEATLERCTQIKRGLEETEKRYAVVGELRAMTNGDNQFRMSLVDYAIAATFEDVLEAANTRFTRMSRGRFALIRRTEMKDGRSRAGLDIAVHDTFTDRSRDAHTLSGGESFMAALSLALGLSDVVQQRAGGIKLDVIFIDEGFGSLDDQALDNALSTLRDLVGNNRAVGVISHIEMVKQQIQAGFEIARGPRGSRVNQRTIQ